jgi:glycosyltransferase involved in cell wall biosynthesis
VDVAKFKNQNSKFKIDKKEKRILFIGNFKWIQNIKAADFILKEIWPKIKTEEKIKLWIVGKNIPDYLKELGNDSSIIFDENAPEDTEKIYQKSDILLAPITVGGGTSYKILEAMASGVAVVTTKLGVEGLEAKDKKHALVGESGEQLAKNVFELLEKSDLRKKITENAREFIEENYSWEKIGKQLENVYKSVI